MSTHVDGYLPGKSAEGSASQVYLNLFCLEGEGSHRGLYSKPNKSLQTPSREGILCHNHLICKQASGVSLGRVLALPPGCPPACWSPTSRAGCSQEQLRPPAWWTLLRSEVICFRCFDFDHRCGFTEKAFFWCTVWASDLIKRFC